MGSGRASRALLFAAALAALGAAYTVGYLRLPWKWWYADDPSMLAHAAAVQEPLRIFTDPTVIRGLGGGGAMVPMQLLSFWVDVRLGGTPKVAYTHQVLSFLAAGLLLYALLLRLLPGQAGAAFLLTVLWALLPSTLAVIQYVSARHYLEGLLFSALSLNLLAALPAKGARRPFLLAGIGLSFAAALLSKEIYVAVLPGAMLTVAWRRGERAAAAGMAAMTLAYVVYRHWLLGPVFEYGMPLLGAWQYLRFVLKLPYALVSNYGGYGMLACGAAAGLRFALRGRLQRRVLAGMALAAACSLAAIVPVSYALYGGIRNPDTWYRILFLLNTQVLLCGGYLTVRAAGRRLQAAVLTLALLACWAGARKTRAYWANATASAELEGKFYLANPRKVLLSAEEAWWFIPGIHSMYGVKQRHYVLARQNDGRGVAAGTPVWRLRGGRFVEEHYDPDRGTALD